MNGEGLLEFIDWLRGEGIVLAERVNDDSGRLPAEYLHETSQTDRELVHEFLVGGSE